MGAIIGSAVFLGTLCVVAYVSYVYMARRGKRGSLQIAKSVATAVVLATVALFGLLFLFKTFNIPLAIQPLVVQGGSMLTTYRTGDLALVNTVSREFGRKDIVVFNDPVHPDRTLVARIIGLPSERVEVKNGDVFINGKVLDETAYWSDESVTNGTVSVTLAGDEYFVLGDNRVTAFDSREFGAIIKESIKGRIFYTLSF